MISTEKSKKKQGRGHILCQLNLYESHEYPTVIHHLCLTCGPSFESCAYVTNAFTIHGTAVHRAAPSDRTADELEEMWRQNLVAQLP
jgi:hypothetical protein